MEKYFEMKFLCEFIIPIAIFCILVALSIVYIAYAWITQSIKYNYLKKQGYERKPANMAVSCNSYKWVKGDKSISESRVDRMKLSELKEYIVEVS